MIRLATCILVAALGAFAVAALATSSLFRGSAEPAGVESGVDVPHAPVEPTT
jgi:hypothetical protein